MLDTTLESQPYPTGREFGLADIAYLPWILRGMRVLARPRAVPGAVRVDGAVSSRPSVAAETAVVGPWGSAPAWTARRHPAGRGGWAPGGALHALVPGRRRISTRPTLYGLGGSMDEWADAVLEQVDGSVAVVGASMGGYCALAIARRAPERLRGLVLRRRRAGADSPERRAGRAETVRLIREGGVEALWDDMRPKLLPEDAPTEAVETPGASRCCRSRSSSLPGSRRSATGPTRPTSCAASEVPLLVIAGTEDTYPHGRRGRRDRRRRRPTAAPSSSTGSGTCRTSSGPTSSTPCRRLPRRARVSDTIDIDELAERLGEPGLTVLDVRTEAEYTGAAGYPCDPRQGRIPDARHLDVALLAELSTDELRKVIGLARGGDRRLLPRGLALGIRGRTPARGRLPRAELRGLVARVVAPPTSDASPGGRGELARRPRGTRRRAPGRSPSRRRAVDRSRRAARSPEPRSSSESTSIQSWIWSRVTSAWNWIPQARSPSRNACVHTLLRASSAAPAGRS